MAVNRRHAGTLKGCPYGEASLQPIVRNAQRRRKLLAVELDEHVPLRDLLAAMQCCDESGG